MAEVADRPSIVLAPDELHEITGYTQAAKQLAELQRQGFWRARRNAMGAVVLERSHYEAVCRGEQLQPSQDGPRLRSPKLRTAT